MCVFLFVGSQDFSVVSMEEVAPAVQETSIKRLVVGPLDIRLHSSAVHRILKMVTCAMDHEYEPYCKPQRGQASNAYSCSICFTGLTLTAKSQLINDRSLYCLHSPNVTLVSSLLFSSLLFWTATIWTLQYPHHIVISLHNPSFNTQLYMKVVTFWTK